VIRTYLADSLPYCAMSTEQVFPSPAAPVPVARQASLHPLSPLTSGEITECAQTIRGLYPGGVELIFKTITLEEPPKAILAPYLDAQHHGRGRPASSIDRKALVAYYICNTVSGVVMVDCIRLLTASGQIP
jgi:Cu2+-containing amine oxidase